MNILKTHEMQEGSGVTVRRLFPLHRDHLVADPFVLWDDFSIGADAGFPTHSHRGFEAITYLFEGTMNHADNLGNDSTVTAGGAQRFTAGKGITHSEMPANSDTGNVATTGIQLWINLPQELKSIDPAYQQVDANDIPQTESDGVVVREIVGGNSPLKLHTEVYYAEVRIPAGGQYRLNVPNNFQGIAYLQTGSITIEDDSLEVGDALQVHPDDTFRLIAPAYSRVMIALGKPWLETVRLNGGFVD